MAKITTGFSMSLDGFVAGANDDPENSLGDGGERLFRWYFTGDTDVQVPSGNRTFKVSRDGADLIEEASHGAGVLVTGRRTFDIAHAWGGRHPMNVPIVVLTHQVPKEWVNSGSPFTFITDGLGHAIQKARELAGEKNVVIGAPSVVKQCLQSGLMDEIHIDLIPALLFSGIRLFDAIGVSPMDLELLEADATGPAVHLTYRVIK